MKLTFTSLFFILFSRALYGQDDFFRPTYVFEGIMNTEEGQILRVNMNFLILGDSTIVGSYYYKPLSGTLHLAGKLNADHSFMISERNEKDSITGYFTGILAADKSKASGLWTSPERNKGVVFKLTRVEGRSYWDYIKKNRALHEYTDLQLAIEEAERVLSIDVAGQGLSNLPVRLSKLKNIVSINLLGNNFTSFPTVLSRLTTLEEISLCSNKLTSVGREIGRLTNLRILIMNNNQLTELPTAIGELSNLLYLELGNNRLKQVPETIKFLTNLQELHIERNALSESEKLRIKNLLPNCVIHF